MYFLPCCRLSFHFLDGIIFTFHYLICLPTDWVNPINSTSPFLYSLVLSLPSNLDYICWNLIISLYLRTAPALSPSTDYPFWTYFTCHSEVFSAAPSAHIWSSDSTFGRVVPVILTRFISHHSMWLIERSTGNDVCVTTRCGLEWKSWGRACEMAFWW